MQGLKINQNLSEEPQTCQSLNEQLICYILDINYVKINLCRWFKLNTDILCCVYYSDIVK